MRTKPRLAAIGALLILSLSGCVKMEMDIELRPDDQVDVSLLMAVQSDVAQVSGQSPDQIADQLATELDATGLGNLARSEVYDDGEYVGTIAYFEDIPLYAFNSPISAGDGMSVERVGDEYVFNASITLVDPTAELDPATESLAAMLEIQFSVTFPGRVTDHNGDLSGRTVTWRPGYGDHVEMYARGGATANFLDTFGLPLLIGAGAVLAVVVLVLLLTARARKRRTAIAPLPGPYYDVHAWGPGSGAPSEWQPSAQEPPAGHAPPPQQPGGQQPSQPGGQPPSQQPGWQQPPQPGGQPPSQQPGWQQPPQPGGQPPSQQPGWQQPPQS